MRDDVAIVDAHRLIPLAGIMRRLVIETHRAQATSTSTTVKAEALYRYLASPEFRQEFNGLFDITNELSELLTKERHTHQRVWARQESLYGEITDRLSGIDETIQSIMQRSAKNPRRAVVRTA